MKFSVLAAVVLLGVSSLAHAQDEPLSAPDIVGTILMVVTGHGEIAEGQPTGLWLDEFSVPYRLFVKAGYTVMVASPLGGATPIDPRSVVEGMKVNDRVRRALETTTRLADVDFNAYDAVFFPGGHGTMFDLPDNDSVKRVVSHFVGADRPAAFVCHGPAALVGATLADGSPVVKGRRITAFTNEEERAVELDQAMPFLLQSRLEELGATVVTADAFGSHVIVDGNLITGQNPASAGAAAEALLAALKVGS